MKLLLIALFFISCQAKAKENVVHYHYHFGKNPILTPAQAHKYGWICGSRCHWSACGFSCSDVGQKQKKNECLKKSCNAQDSELSTKAGYSCTLGCRKDNCGYNGVCENSGSGHNETEITLYNKCISTKCGAPEKDFLKPLTWGCSWKCRREHCGKNLYCEAGDETKNFKACNAQC